MARKKQIFPFTYDFSFSLFCIISHQRDYRLCYELNKTLGVDLQKKENLDLKAGKLRESVEFSLYKYSYDDEKTLCVIANKNGTHTLIPEMSSTDYFVILQGGFAEETKSNIRRAIKTCKTVLGVYETDPETLKSKENLIL